MKKYMTKRRKTERAHWKIIAFVTLVSINAQIFPYALDVLRPGNNHFPQAQVHAKELEVAEKKAETVEQTIRRLAQEANFLWPDYLVRLANCESTLKPNATNRSGNKPVQSFDRGVFQINSYWHKEVTDEQAYDLEWATKWTIKRINAGYQHEWACDTLVRKNPAKYNP